MMRNVWSRALGSVGLAVILGAPACVQNPDDATGASALTNPGASPEDPTDRDADGRPRGPEGPDMNDGRRGPGGPRGPGMEPPHRGDDDACLRHHAELEVCYSDHGQVCDALFEDLGACHEAQLAPCEALMTSFFECAESNANDCEPLREQAEQCFEHAHVLCAGLEEAADQCFAPCLELERDLDRVCGGAPECPPPEPFGAPTCELLIHALDQCFAEHAPDVCVSVEAAVIAVCERSGPGEPPPDRWPPPEDPEAPPGE